MQIHSKLLRGRRRHGNNVQTYGNIEAIRDQRQHTEVRRRVPIEKLTQVLSGKVNLEATEANKARLLRQRQHREQPNLNHFLNRLRIGQSHLITNQEHLRTQHGERPCPSPH